MKGSVASVLASTMTVVATAFVVAGCSIMPDTNAGACVDGSDNSELVNWSANSYSVFGTAVLRIIDPESNLAPGAVDNFDLSVWSDTDINGISLTVTETDENSSIFEGTVFLTTSDASSGHRLMASSGDAMIAEYRRVRATSCLE